LKTEKEGNKESEKYYDGYYWSNEPYSSRALPGRKNDEELRKEVISKHANLGFSGIEVRVNNGAVILSGSVQNYVQRSKVGAGVWKIPCVVEVLNNLHVEGADTAGPALQ
jgi:osmotically-inducible protein OsmY